MVAVGLLGAALLLFSGVSTVSAARIALHQQLQQHRRADFIANLGPEAPVDDDHIYGDSFVMWPAMFEDLGQGACISASGPALDVTSADDGEDCKDVCLERHDCFGFYTSGNDTAIFCHFMLNDDVKVVPSPNDSMHCFARRLKKCEEMTTSECITVPEDQCYLTVGLLPKDQRGMFGFLPRMVCRKTEQAHNTDMDLPPTTTSPGSTTTTSTTPQTISTTVTTSTSTPNTTTTTATTTETSSPNPLSTSTTKGSTTTTTTSGAGKKMFSSLGVALFAFVFVPFTSGSRM